MSNIYRFYSILVTMDMRSLYINIPNKERIEALKTTWKTYRNKRKYRNENYLDISRLVFNIK